MHGVQEIAQTGIITGTKSELRYVSAFGSKGSGEGQLSSPTAIQIDPTTGDLDATDTGNNRIEEFLPKGTYVGRVGSAGVGPERFESPHGLAINKNGDLYVADYSNNRVDIWEPMLPWVIQTVPAPKGAIDSYFWGASCTRASECTAVGEYVLSSGENPPLAERWNGTSWSLQSIAGPSGATNYAGRGVMRSLRHVPNRWLLSDQRRCIRLVGRALDRHGMADSANAGTDRHRR